MLSCASYERAAGAAGGNALGPAPSGRRTAANDPPNGPLATERRHPRRQRAGPRRGAVALERRRPAAAAAAAAGPPQRAAPPAPHPWSTRDRRLCRSAGRTAAARRVLGADRRRPGAATPSTWTRAPPARRRPTIGGGQPWRGQPGPSFPRGARTPTTGPRPARSCGRQRPPSPTPCVGGRHGAERMRAAPPHAFWSAASPRVAVCPPACRRRHWPPPRVGRHANDAARRGGRAAPRGDPTAAPLAAPPRRPTPRRPARRRRPWRPDRPPVAPRAAGPPRARAAAGRARQTPGARVGAGAAPDRLARGGGWAPHGARARGGAVGAGARQTLWAPVVAGRRAAGTPAGRLPAGPPTAWPGRPAAAPVPPPSLLPPPPPPPPPAPPPRARLATALAGRRRARGRTLARCVVRETAAQSFGSGAAGEWRPPPT